jgi:hypothetical protein
MHRVPKDLPHDGRCGSTAEMFGTEVDARRHDDVSTVTTRPACSPQSAGTGHRSSRSPTSLLGSPRPGLTTPGGHGKAATDQRSTSRRPDQPFAHRAPSVTAIACRRPAVSPRDNAPEPPSTGSAPGPPSFPEDSMRGPIPVAGPPGEPDGRSRERPQRQLISSGNRQTHRTIGYVLRGHVDVATAVIPAGQRAHNEAASIHTCSDSGWLDPSPERAGARPRSTPQNGADPLLDPPSAATTQTTPSELGGLPPRSN